HELGHYYRAHIAAPETQYDFFYQLERRNAPVRPEAEASLNPIGEKAVAASTLLSISNNYAKVPRQKLRSELYFGVGTIIEAVCAQEDDCPSACQEASEYISNSASVQALGTFPFTSSEAAIEAYPKFESKALACLQNLSLADDEN